ncbi:MAG: GNAT family N-acetyltransferase [Herpetosiphonaceae bacterium]|nr:GNAT family N-acetyltransferase [Herpetosiphonaceae bacterium]
MDTRVQAYMRVGASHGRATERIGPFLATFTAHTDNPYLNYALPDDGATPSDEDVAALIVAFAARSRRPRLEYVSRLAPAVEPRLLAAGFMVEDQLPLMICERGEERAVASPAGIDIGLPTTDADLFGMIAAQNEAFGGAPPAADDVERLRASIEAGQIAVLARVVATGEVVGGGVCIAPADGISEIAGIGVRGSFRRRGIAGALTARLVDEAFAVGVQTVFLTPGNEAAGRVYLRAGFATAGEILHISKPPCALER